MKNRNTGPAAVLGRERVEYWNELPCEQIVHIVLINIIIILVLENNCMIISIIICMSIKYSPIF